MIVNTYGVMTGVDTARKIREEDQEIKLIFCTTSNEFASESYALNVDYYLRKPYTKEHIEGMCKRLHLEHVEAGRYLMLPDGQKLIVKNFIYSEYYNHVITIHTKKGEDMKTRMSHSNLVNLLCSYPGFVACSMQSSTDRRIQLKSSYKNGNIFVLTVDNTCENKVKKDKEGVFLSTKHKGNGIGVESVKNIAQRYQGVCRIELENGMFRISVMLKG